jgi:hypothetical protein
MSLFLLDSQDMGSKSLAIILIYWSQNAITANEFKNMSTHISKKPSWCGEWNLASLDNVGQKIEEISL